MGSLGLAMGQIRAGRIVESGCSWARFGILGLFRVGSLVTFSPIMMRLYIFYLFQLSIFFCNYYFELGAILRFQKEGTSS